MQSTQMQELFTYKWGGGYFNTDKFASMQDSLAVGSKNLFVLGAENLRVFRGIKAESGLGARTLFNVAGGYAGLIDKDAVLGIGSIWNFVNESLFWIGGGEVVFNGVILTDDTPTTTNFTATSTLQLSPKVTSYTYEEAYAAGFTAPDAPVVAAKEPSVAFEGKMDGLYSFQIARVRSETGGRSVSSATSAVIMCQNETVRITFPLASTNGQDRWMIFGTKAGFGGTGVHYGVMEVAESDLTTIDGIARSFEFEYDDSDLLPITAWTDDYPPPAGMFGGRLESHVVVVGCYDNAIACSIRNFPESFNPEHLAFLPQQPTAVMPDQQGSFLYVATKTSVHALSVAPGTFDNPMMIQTMWSDTGIENPHNWCASEGVIFAFVSRQGAVTMNAMGQPDTSFAIPVQKEMAMWETADVRVFPCPDLNGVLYVHSPTNKAYLFNTQNRKWSSPAEMGGQLENNQNIISGVVLNRRLQVCAYDSFDTTFSMFTFDEPEDDFTAKYLAISPDLELNPGGRVNVLGLKGRCFSSDDNDTEFKLYVDYNDTALKTLTHSAPAVGVQTTVRTKWAVFRKEAVKVSVGGEQSDFTKDCYPGPVILYGTAEQSNRLA